MNSCQSSFPSFASVKALIFHLYALTLVTLATGCSLPRPLHGGRAVTSGPITQSLSQTENPSAPSRQDQETIRTRTYTIPPSTTPSLQYSTTPILLTDREESRARSELGPAQKDTSRELAAKLSSLKGIVWVGLGLFIFGIASMFWPPLRAIIGSVTTSAAITLGGLALIILPTLIVGNELLILAGVAVTVGAWFLAHRHGHLRGQLATHQALSAAKPRS